MNRIGMISVRVAKRRVLTQKAATESQYSHLAGYGNVWSKMDTAPVPIVEVNHLHKGQHESLFHFEWDLTLA